MKLLFVENRYTTWVYAPVAARLATLGHRIHWLVQNPVFAPRDGRIHRLSFPSSGSSTGAREPAATYDWLSSTDRGVLHFGVDTAHYAHYDRQIQKVLEDVGPDAIFGEASEFHELLAIRRARERRIPYLSPSVTRYPADRLAFLSYDTLDPIGGDGSVLSDAEADAMLDEIRSRRIVPSYMRPAGHLPRTMPLVRLADKLRITAGWVAGERFITPSPLRKLQLGAKRRAAHREWEVRAAARPGAFAQLIDSGRPWVLYPLQMQPEANIDVWGSPWNDQAELIRRAARALAPHGATLVVKPNPKSKYELLGALNGIVEQEPNVVRLAHATPMREVFPLAPLVLTVTGTVLLESIFAGKPVASLGNHSMRRYPGVSALETPESLPAILQMALARRLPQATPRQARELLQFLHRSSYAATMWDPVTQPQADCKENIDKLVRAFVQLLAQGMPGPDVDIREASPIAEESPWMGILK